MAKRSFELTRRGLLGLMGASTATAALGPVASAAFPTPPGGRAAQLFHTDVGSGPDVMLLHGWTCDSHDWSWQLPVLESKYRVVAPDLRGHGRSEIMPPGAYSPADYVADIEALIVASHRGRKFVLVGHSMGAQIAARLAAKRPDLVRGVVSIDGALGFDAAAARLFGKVARDLAAGDPARVVPGFSSRSTIATLTQASSAGTRGASRACPSTSCARPLARSSWGQIRLAPGRRAPDSVGSWRSHSIICVGTLAKPTACGPCSRIPTPRSRPGRAPGTGSCSTGKTK